MSLRARHLLLAILAGAAVLGGAAFYRYGRAVWHPVYRRLAGTVTEGDVLRASGPGAESRVRLHFQRAGVAYPPGALTLLAFKEEKRLELWARAAGQWAYLRTYPILAASGGAGPKLREGDRQVPEGVYRVELLNPNSSYHLSMKLDYPNAYDRARAAEDRRTNLGGDIFIHGKAVSIGCIAVGDAAIEELFFLATRVGIANITVVIAPYDARPDGVAATPRDAPAWVADLYRRIEAALRAFPPPQNRGPGG